MLERLTGRTGNGQIYLVEGPEEDMYGYYTGKGLKQIEKVIDRLAAYEDSGLSPEELQELAQAKTEGKLVVLPCKPGDTVYRIISYKCNAVCNKLNACNSFIYNACKQAEFYVCPGTFQLNDMGWIGKTVFLSREAAEKALEVGE